MKILFCLFVSIFTFSSFAIPIVEESQFEKGSTWRWLYSEKNAGTGEWTPYFIEQYRVIAKQGNKVTIEMSSRAFNDAGPLLAHHRFQVSFSDCKRMNSGMLHNSLTVKFWAKSQNGGWDLVNNQHPGLVFTEKFNCSPRALNSYAEITLDGFRWPLFQNISNVDQYDSWYFLSHPQWTGVVGRKLFEPTGEYQFEIMDVP